MRVRDVHLPAPSANVFVALELSKVHWLVGNHSPNADKMSPHSVTGGDSRALLELFGWVRRQAEQEFGLPVVIINGYEADYDGFWLHRLLRAAGLRPGRPAARVDGLAARRGLCERLGALRAGDRGSSQ